MSELDNYSRYFPVGIKIGVGIPLPNAEIFKDWAVIHDIEEDLITLQLSRDVLPSKVTLNYGQILELRGGKEGAGYCCRAIIVSEGDARELLLRLIGEIVSDELREFYRIDAFLPIKYYIPSDQHIDVLHKQWEARRIQSEQKQLEQKDHRWDGALVAGTANLPQERLQKADADNQENEDDIWDTIIPLAANISGGGVRMITHQGFDSGDFVLLEILVPTPRRVVDIIARVIFANPNFSAGSKHPFFNTGLQFVYVDERDRDAIVNYISNVQLKRIRQLRETYLFRNNEEDSNSFAGGGHLDSRQIIIWAAVAIFIVFISGGLGAYLWHYAHNHPKGEIEKIFDGGLRQYLDKYK